MITLCQNNTLVNVSQKYLQSAKSCRVKKTTNIYGHINTVTPVTQYYVNTESQLNSCLHCACFRVHSLFGQGQ